MVVHVACHGSFQRADADAGVPSSQPPAGRTRDERSYIAQNGYPGDPGPFHLGSRCKRDEGGVDLDGAMAGGKKGDDRRACNRGRRHTGDRSSRIGPARIEHGFLSESIHLFASGSRQQAAGSRPQVAGRKAMGIQQQQQPKIHPCPTLPDTPFPP